MTELCKKYNLPYQLEYSATNKELKIVFVEDNNVITLNRTVDQHTISDKWLKILANFIIDIYMDNKVQSTYFEKIAKRGLK